MPVQYNPFGDLKTHGPDEARIFNDSNGSIIAVSYEARAKGVKRCAAATPRQAQQPRTCTEKLRPTSMHRVPPIAWFALVC